MSFSPVAVIQKEHDLESWYVDEYRKLDALWIHDGNPLRPHALLTSGNHSNGFFDSLPVVTHLGLLEVAVSDLVTLLIEGDVDLHKVDMVVGPQTGATKLAEALSLEITLAEPQFPLVGGLRTCLTASPAKHFEGGVKSMVFNEEEWKSLLGRHILLCDDVLTTGSSIELTERAITQGGGVVLPYVVVLVNRSGLSEVNGKKIIALIDHPMPIWEARECPLCAQGSVALRPKEEGNWAQLNQNY